MSNPALLVAPLSSSLAYTDRSGSGALTGVFVGASSGVFVAHQAGTLTPNTHGIYGSLGSTYRKTNAAAAADVLWCKTSGAPNAITGWTQVTP